MTSAAFDRVLRIQQGAVEDFFLAALHAALVVRLHYHSIDRRQYYLHVNTLAGCVVMRVSAATSAREGHCHLIGWLQTAESCVRQRLLRLDVNQVM